MSPRHCGGSLSPLTPPCLELLIPKNTSGAFPLSPQPWMVQGSSPQKCPGLSQFLTLFPLVQAGFLGCFHSDFSLCLPLSAQLSVNSKPPGSEGQGDKKDNATAPPAPPSYEEATAGEGMKGAAFPAPPAAPLHPSWAYVDPSKSFLLGWTGGRPWERGRDPPGVERRGGIWIRGGTGIRGDQG